MGTMSVYKTRDPTIWLEASNPEKLQILKLKKSNVKRQN
jgi:hypothetical protein